MTTLSSRLYFVPGAVACCDHFTLTALPKDLFHVETDKKAISGHFVFTLVVLRQELLRVMTEQLFFCSMQQKQRGINQSALSALSHTCLLYTSDAADDC